MRDSSKWWWELVDLLNWAGLALLAAAGLIVFGIVSGGPGYFIAGLSLWAVAVLLWLLCLLAIPLTLFWIVARTFAAWGGKDD